MSDELLHRTKDHPRDCVHGSQIGKCDTCDLDDAENQIKALELALAEAKQKVTELAAHNALLMQVSWEMKEGKPDAFYKIKDARNSTADDALAEFSRLEKRKAISELNTYFVNRANREDVMLDLNFPDWCNDFISLLAKD
jgi:hypothetical protein|tara:strand:- start:82300 stop:82719 length:420 start_codon:yes stop_codon:yes gene_type:complete